MIRLGIGEKPEDGIVGGQGGKKFPEKDVSLDQHAYDDDLVIIVAFEGVPARKLKDIENDLEE